MQLQKPPEWAQVVALLPATRPGASVLQASVEEALLRRVGLVLVPADDPRERGWRHRGLWLHQVTQDLESGWPGLAVTSSQTLGHALRRAPSLLVASWTEASKEAARHFSGPVLVPARDHHRHASRRPRVAALLQQSVSDEAVLAAAVREATTRRFELQLVHTFLPDPGEPADTAAARAEHHLRAALDVARASGLPGMVAVNGFCWNGPTVRLLTRPPALGRLLVLDPTAELDRAEVDLILQAGTSDVLLVPAAAANVPGPAMNAALPQDVLALR